MAGNPSNIASRMVNVTDQDPPVITLSGANPIILNLGDSFQDPGAIWEDTVDGTGFLSSTTSGSVDTATI